jgi:transposase
MQQDFYLGIDVSKGYADFIILNKDKKVVEDNFQLDDTFEGHNQLFKIVSYFIARQPEAKIFAAVESTGGYENNWLGYLSKCQSKLQLSVARVNPFGVNYNSKATLKRIITDKESAKNVAEYLISHPEKIQYNNEDYYSSARRQWTFIKMLTKQKVQLLNQLESLLYIANPEVLRYCSNKVNLWTLKMLKQYPTANHLAKVRLSTLGKIPYITEPLAKDLINNAKKSVASSVDNTTAEIIKALAEQILQLRKLIYLQTKQLEEACNLAEVELLKSFRGIGTYSAVGLMIEILSVERFSSVKKLASFFGIHPVFKQSGDGLSGYKMSKRGRKEPRQILFNVARFAVVHNSYIKEIYVMHLKKGMPKMAALGAVMYKILRIVYGMLKNNKPFDPEIDRANRAKHNSVDNQNKPDYTRRYQPMDIKAPISRRQIKKRKEQGKSQNLKPLNAESPKEIFTGSDSHSFPVALKET